MSKTSLDRLHDSTREMYDTIGNLERQLAEAQGKLAQLTTEAYKQAGPHKFWCKVNPHPEDVCPACRLDRTLSKEGE